MKITSVEEKSKGDCGSRIGGLWEGVKEEGGKGARQTGLLLRAGTSQDRKAHQQLKNIPNFLVS